MDPPASGRPRAGVLRAPVLPRDDPRAPAPPQAVVDESQEAARPCRPGVAASLYRTAPGPARRRPARSASPSLLGRGAHPPRRRSWLWLGWAWRALVGRLHLAGALGQGLVLRPLLYN